MFAIALVAALAVTVALPFATLAGSPLDGLDGGGQNSVEEAQETEVYDIDTPEADASGDIGDGSEALEDDGAGEEASGEAAPSGDPGEEGSGSGPDGLADGEPAELPADSLSAQDDGQAQTDLQALPRGLSPQSLSLSAIAPMAVKTYTVGDGKNYANPTIALASVSDSTWVMELYQDFKLGAPLIITSGDVTIQSAGGNVYSINAQKIGRAIKVTGSGTKLTLKNVKITNGYSIDKTSKLGGGGVLVDAFATFIMDTGSEISGNTAEYGGGGVYIANKGIFTMKAGKISGNTTTLADTKNGGGVYLDNATFTMEGGEISGNAIAGSGSGVFVGAGSSFTMKNGKISNNKTTANGRVGSGNDNGGGGVAVIPGQNGNATFTMTGGEISGNEAKGEKEGVPVGCGGGVFVGEHGTAKAIINGSVKILDNKASLYGGGIFVDSFAGNYDYTKLDLQSSGSIAFSGNESKSYTLLRKADKTNMPWTPAGLVTSLSVSGINNLNGLSDTADSRKKSALNDYDIGYRGVCPGEVTVEYIDEDGEQIDIDRSVQVGEDTKYALKDAPEVAPIDTKWVLSDIADTDSALTVSQGSTKLAKGAELDPGSEVALALNASSSGVALTFTYFPPAEVYCDITYKGLLDGDTLNTKPEQYAVYYSTTSVGNPERVGYTFDGWTAVYFNQSWNVTAKTKNFVIPKNHQGGVTLTAHWSVRTDIVLNFGTNGGTGGTTQLTGLTYDKTLTQNGQLLPTRDNGAPTLDGYTFEGWSTSQGTFTAGTGTGNTADFNNGNTVNWTSTDKTVYAVWKARTDMVLKFDANGGGTVTPAQLKGLTYGKTIAGNGKSLPTLSQGAPTLYGYNFAGWSTSKGTLAAGTGTDNTADFTNDSLVNWTPTDKTVYAVWTNAITTLKVSCAVSGDYANKEIGFSYNVTLKGADGNPLTGTLDYTGGGGKQGGTLTLADGSAEFTLKHGESITIKDVPLGGKVKIVQTGNEHYKASYADPDATGTGSDLNAKTVDSSGDSLELSERTMSLGRAFAFTNTRETVVPASVDAGDVPALLIALAFVLIAALYPARWVSRFRAEGRPNIRYRKMFGEYIRRFRAAGRRAGWKSI
jgi:uncharacterized repeat protein (TIGR02543 family)